MSIVTVSDQRPNPKKNLGYMGPHAGVDYTSPYGPIPESTPNTFTMGNPIPELTLTICQSRLYPPVKDFGFGLNVPNV